MGVTSAAKKILDEALALPEEDRATIVDALSESLRDLEELSPEWRAEIARRIDAIERGESRVIPGDEVEARIERALSKR